MRFKQVGFLAAGVLAASLALAGCADDKSADAESKESSSASTSDEKCEGKWEPTEVTIDGEPLTAEDFDKELAALGGSESSDETGEFGLDDMFSLDMKSDKKFELKYLLEDETLEGTWKDAKGGCEIVVNGETKMLPIEEGVMTLEMDESNSLGFVKK